MYCSSTVHIFKNIKNGSHDTIHIFKNYFATMFSVFSFNNNKFNPNRPYVKMCVTSWYVKQPWEIKAKIKSNVLFMILQHSRNNPFVHGTHQVK